MMFVISRIGIWLGSVVAFVGVEMVIAFVRLAFLFFVVIRDVFDGAFDDSGAGLSLSFVGC